MNSIWKQSFTRIIFSGTLALSAVGLLADEEPTKSTPPVESEKDGYTINYNTVSIVEYIKFASKICNTNFIFNEAELPFTVTVVSDAPITPENVMATLIQTLRIHGLMLLEQGNNLVIHKSPNVRQPATLVFDEENSHGAPIITRLFRLKNANVDSVATIIRPMISEESLLEVSHETRQLILTDATAVVDKIAALIENLDAPHTSLEIRTFEAKFNKPEYLIELASQIMNPIAQGNPFILVPQTLANAVFLVSTPELNEKAMSVLASLDTPPKRTVLSERKIKSENIFVIKLEHRSGDDVLRSLKDIATNLQENGVLEGDLLDTIESAKWIRDTNSLMFVGSPESNVKIKEFITSLDVPAGNEENKVSFFVYKPQNRGIDEVKKSMQEMADNLSKTKGADENLIQAIHSQKVNPLTHTIMYSGDPTLFPRIKDLLATIDTPSTKGARLAARSNFYVYKIQSAPVDQIEASLKSFASGLENSGVPEEGIVNAINNLKYIKETNSLVFVGPDDALKRLQELLPQFDAGVGQQSIPPSTQFFAYKPQSLRGESLMRSLKETADSLKTSLADPALLHALESMKYVKNTNTLLFTGDPTSLKKIEELVVSIDVQSKAGKPGMERNFFLYKTQYASQARTEAYLNQVAEHLNKINDAELIDTIHSMKWIEPSQSFMFSGSENSLNRIKDLLSSFDDAEKLPKPNYFVYKLQNPQGDLIEEDIDTLLKNMQDSGLKDSPLAHVLETLRYVKETNSFLLTGNPAAIDEAKDLIAKYDYPRSQIPNSNFFMYKPQHVTAAQITKSLRDIETSLKNAELFDPNLLATIHSMKYVESTNSFIFTGSPDAISKIQGLLKDIDVESPHAIHIGPTTFLMYKLKNANGSQISSSLKAISNDLKKSGTTDKDFLAALDSLKYVRETNSLMFTGPEESLAKVQALVEKFDVSSLGGSKIEKEMAGSPTDFFVYKPQYLAGADLEKTLTDFGENLKMSGLNDPGLFNTLQTMKYIEKTQSLVFTGDQKSLDRVRGLLKEFDVSANLPEGAPSNESSIQAIDNTSFLVYKLEFHKGDEIQNALRQIAKDLILTSAPVNQTLLNSINSIQWLEVTNSLLCSGDQETLTRLRELIKNLDVPLKQVFIEVLVLQTSLTNALTFGLEWGGKFQYKNKVAGSINNFIPSTASPYPPPNSFESGLQSVSATTTPNPNTMIPFSPNFETGVIGDIIKHNGQSFISLGSLMNALESDAETTVVMTPKIIAQDSKTATIFVGQNVPFAGSFIANQTANSMYTSNLEYRDIGMNLSITPVLGNSDIITLDISLDDSVQVGPSTGANFSISNGSVTNSAQGITTSRTTLQTTVHVPNKNFLVLSGMVNNSNNKVKTGIPCLGGIPIIGTAFSTNNDTATTSNVVIFMRPTIINSLEEMKTLSRDQEEFFRSQAGTPNLEHNYDEAMEIIKSPEDE